MSSKTENLQTQVTKLQTLCYDLSTNNNVLYEQASLVYKTSAKLLGDYVMYRLVYSDDPHDLIKLHSLIQDAFLWRKMDKLPSYVFQYAQLMQHFINYVNKPFAPKNPCIFVPLITGGMPGGNIPGGNIPGGMPGGNIPGGMPGGNIPGGMPGGMPGGNIPGGMPGNRK
jgi:hypothetical protein